MRRLLPFVFACAGTPVVDAPADTDPWLEPALRCAASDPLRQPWFGDTHVHTRWSLDAATQGTRLGPDDAYRFAKGEAVGIQPYAPSGEALRTVKLDRPLDFVAVADHAEFLGLLRLCETPGSAAYDHSSCVQIRENPQAAFLLINAGTAAEPDNVRQPLACIEHPDACLDASLSVWDDLRKAAEDAYDTTEACTFTSFAAWEWSAGPGTKNMHRNVIFRSSATTPRAFSYFDAPTPVALWDALDAGCKPADGCDVVALPHNSNLSSGLMFATVDDENLPTETPAQLARRARMEPLVEVFQHKGDSECWPGSPAADEACGFEKLPYNTLSGANLDLRADPVPRDFVRDVLGEGLRYRKRTGANPYTFGLIASSDTHLGTPGLVSEDGFPGHGGAGPGARDELPLGLPDNVFFNPGGLAVLWAEENSRESLFRALRRREAYGTSGPRIVLRSFVGWDLPEDACTLDPKARAQLGYDKGVPMGGDLGAPPSATAVPRVLVWAEADAGTPTHPGADLQRLQVVRGTLEGDTPAWDVIDVAGDASMGLGLDLGTCAPASGSEDLCAVWTDTDFDRASPAFWYTRVLEVPTCRWQTRQCVAAGITCPTDRFEFAGCCELDLPASGQERAWGSPVWWSE